MIWDTIIASLQIIVKEAILFRLEKLGFTLEPGPGLFIIALNIRHVFDGGKIILLFGRAEHWRHLFILVLILFCAWATACSHQFYHLGLLFWACLFLLFWKIGSNIEWDCSSILCRRDCNLILAIICKLCRLSISVGRTWKTSRNRSRILFTGCSL